MLLLLPKTLKSLTALHSPHYLSGFFICEKQHEESVHKHPTLTKTPHIQLFCSHKPAWKCKCSQSPDSSPSACTELQPGSFPDLPHPRFTLPTIALQCLCVSSPHSHIYPVQHPLLSPRPVNPLLRSKSSSKVPVGPKTRWKSPQNAMRTTKVRERTQAEKQDSAGTQFPSVTHY